MFYMNIVQRLALAALLSALVAILALSVDGAGISTGETHVGHHHS